MAKKYIENGGLQVLDAMDDIAASKNITVAELAIAWLLYRDGVTAPIASATKESHLKSLVKASEVSLTPEEVEALAVF